VYFKLKIFVKIAKSRLLLCAVATEIISYLATLTPQGGLRIVARLLVSLTLCHFSTLKTFLLLLLGTPVVFGVILHFLFLFLKQYGNFEQVKRVSK
jgi:hypothetical protein